MPCRTKKCGIFFETRRIDMNTKMILSAVAAAVLGLTMAAPVMAQQAEAASAPAAVKVTPAEKAAARAHRRAAAAAAQKKGEIKTGDAAPTKEAKPVGTLAQRRAAHKAQRAKIAAAQKKGEVA
ncbi:MAG: hypothetical protein KGL43_25550, partial [Burkholderiales bacterium]|nr:hypothetical protein [Burkholderiales bacterium]